MKTYRSHAVSCLMLVALSIFAAGCKKKLATEHILDALGRAVDSAPVSPGAQAARWPSVQEIYRGRKYEPIWVELNRVSDRGRDLIASLADAESQGLRPGDYDLPGLRNALLRAYAPKVKRDSIPAAIADLELRLTATFLDYATHLFSGRLDAAVVDSGWFIAERRTGVDSIVRNALAEKKFADIIGRLAPRQSQYADLVKALAEYRGLAARGGWDSIPIPPRVKLEINDSSPLIPLVRRRLAITGELKSRATGDSLVLDSALAGAVALFQERHGLETDSTIGRGTLQAMNVPVETRVGQIELNMERYRWLPDDLGSRYILVNIPDYHLHAFDQGREVFQMRVVVGKDYENPTPVFADSMSYIVFRPYWNVPPSIVKEEIIPLTKKDPEYINKHNYEILRGREPVDPASIDWAKVDTASFRYHIRQKPGPLNSLGLVKFMFPNQFDVYLHDTPARSLFRRAGRAASHGCIRVEKPELLAQFALSRNPEWNPKKIREAMAREEPQQVGLRQKVPVYIVYFTTFVQDGVPRFRHDLYGTDERAIARLGEGRDDRTLRQVGTELRTLAQIERRK